MLDSRIAQVRKEIDLATAPVIHQFDDRIARLEKGIRNDLGPTEDVPGLLDRISSLRSESHEFRNRILQMETGSQEVRGRLLQLEKGSRDLQERMSRAEDAAHEHRECMTQVARSAQRLELRSSKKAAALVREEWQYLHPKDVTDVDFVRIGRNGDGGYVMLNDLAECRYGISIGVGQEISWDLALADQGINLSLYDHTIGNLLVQHGGIKFRSVGGRSPGDGALNKMSLPEIITAEGLDAECNMLLKMDIEGDEWEVLKGISPQLLGKFSQIVVELHGMCDFDPHDKHLTRLYVLKAIAATHQCIHIHANNWGDYRIIGGIPVPDVVEATFALRSRYAVIECGRRFPTVLDHPNNADCAEFMLMPELLRQEG
jgi:hypothetical protein